MRTRPLAGASAATLLRARPDLHARIGRHLWAGALAMLVRDLEERGTVIAASRRTFFDTEDYLKRTGLERYKKLIVEVADPPATASMLTVALQGRS